MVERVFSVEEAFADGLTRFAGSCTRTISAIRHCYRVTRLLLAPSCPLTIAHGDCVIPPNATVDVQSELHATIGLSTEGP